MVTMFLGGRRRFLSISRALVGSSLLAACVSAPKQTPLMEQDAVLGMTASELQIWMADFALWYAGYMEEQAYAMTTQTDDPITNLNVSRWLLYGVPAFHKTLFHPDPYVSLIDTWVLTEQAIQYYRDGPGRDVFGDQQGVVLATYERFQSMLQEIARTAWMQDNISAEQDSVEVFAREFPIETFYFVRYSAAPLFADRLGHGGSVGATLAGLEQSVAALNTRLSVYTEFIPKQVTWQLNLVGAEIAADSVPFDVESMIPITTYIAGVDSLLDATLAATLEDLERMRLETLAQISQERMAVLQAIAGERKVVLETLSSERVVALDQLGQMVNTGVDRVDATADKLVDTIFIRLLQLTAVWFVALLVYRFLSARVIARRPT